MRAGCCLGAGCPRRRRPVTEAASFVDEHGERRTRRACLDELPDPGHILRDAIKAPEHYGQLAWQRQELGTAVRGSYLNSAATRTALPISRITRSAHRFGLPI